MAKPSDKSPEMEKTLDDLSGKVFGRKRTETIEGNKCVTCGGDASKFDDELSVKEYSISGMCQKCQDEVFKEPEEEEDDDDFAEDVEDPF